MKILIADDEDMIRASLEAMLKTGGDYEVDLAVDGEEALRKVKENLYDLLLCDLDMPKINGYDVLKQVRVIYPTLPVVFITATGDVKKIIQSIAQDKLNAFIEKPFTSEKVLEIVGKALAPKKQAE